MAKAIIVAIVVVVVMAVIVSLLNRDGREGFWKVKESDVFAILGFGVLTFVLFFAASKIVVQNVFWASVIRTLPLIVMIIAIWVFIDRRLFSNSCDLYDDDYDEDDDDDDVVHPWDEEGDDLKWPWDE